ncbi:MAG: Hsp33 family molecular chaperone HslO [Xanthomonadales bacterium]|nr:33 kDa chaperonin [Xanthomonadales bacterium]MCC6591962.1 Hsp33 family molecular chaperone HslO [Xanthomonadales bacterium]MCE7929911.1 Hsp33 family molecular chaperone HslO [Xanthomonadales bacterium PRO6]
MDLLHAFVLPELGVRGAAVRLGAGYREVLSHQPYADAVGRWLGETLAAATLLLTGLKFRGRLSLQLQGGTVLELMYAECTSEGDLRGIARVAEAANDLGRGFDVAAAGAVLAITLEPWQRGERYQGIVPLAGTTLAESLEGYFAQSEQLPTRILLAADGELAAGLLLQRLPAEGGHGAADADGWNRVEHLLGTVAPPELLATDSELLLHRLFHDLERIARDPVPLHVRCRCSREKVADVLRRIGREEAFAASHTLGHAEVVCEFCGRTYRFDPVEIEQLFHPPVGPSSERPQ